jgi:hypothetical protein
MRSPPAGPVEGPGGPGGPGNPWIPLRVASFTSAPVSESSLTSEEDIGRGLSAVAYFSGNTRAAAKALKEQGLSVPRSTLRDWQRTHADRYETLRADLIPRVHERVAEKHLELADAQMEASWEFLQRLRTEKENIPPRDLSTVQRNLDVGSAVHTDKALALRGQGGPAQVNVNISLADQIRSLTARGIKIYDAPEGGNEIPPEQAIEAYATPEREPSDEDSPASN